MNPLEILIQKNTAIVMDIFCKLHLEGKTVIMVIHEIELTERTERIVKMLDGSIIDDIALAKKKMLNFDMLLKLSISLILIILSFIATYTMFEIFGKTEGRKNMDILKKDSPN